MVEVCKEERLLIGPSVELKQRRADGTEGFHRLFALALRHLRRLLDGVGEAAAGESKFWSVVCSLPTEGSAYVLIKHLPETIPRILSPDF